MIRLKITVFGEGAVGKTSLIKQFSERQFKTDYLPTIGCQFLIKELEIAGKHVELLLWDLAGQDRFKFVRQQFFKGSKGSVAVFDLTRPPSLEKIDKWMEDFRNYCGDIPCLLFANKVDLKNDRLIPEEDGKAYVEKQGLQGYYETSAKTGENVNDAFRLLTKLIMAKYENLEEK